MTIVTLSAEEFLTGQIPFSNPRLKQQLAHWLRGYRDTGFETQLLLYREGEPRALCRGGMIVPTTSGSIITAVWPLADTPEIEDELLQAYAAVVAEMSPPRTATLVSDPESAVAPEEVRGPFDPLTRIARYQGTVFPSATAHDFSRHVSFESRSPDDESLLEILESTEEGSQDSPEFLHFMNWRDRLAEYQSTSPQTPLSITLLTDNETPVAAGVWSCNPATREGEIYYLGVRLAVRRRGWGKKLLQHLCAESNKRGGEAIGLNVDLRNHAAVKLYESAGFREVFRRQLWISRHGR